MPERFGRRPSTHDDHAGAERLVRRPRTAVPGGELNVVRNGSESDERVVHGPARDAKSGERLRETSLLVVAEQERDGEPLAEQPSGVNRFETEVAGQAG